MERCAEWYTELAEVPAEAARRTRRKALRMNFVNLAKRYHAMC
jgi:hypothetical protein